MNWLNDLFPLSGMLLVAGSFFLAIFVQSLVGFGSALIAMPLLISILGLKVAVPLFAVVALIFESILVFYYRASLSPEVVLKLGIPAAVGIPLGVVGLRAVNEALLLGILGLVVIGYALYSLLNLRFPELRSSYWAYGSGFIGGLLGGAYNTSGPPVILYADSQRWPAAEFKGNLQGFFIINGIVAVLSHGLAQNLTSQIVTS